MIHSSYFPLKICKIIWWIRAEDEKMWLSKWEMVIIIMAIEMQAQGKFFFIFLALSLGVFCQNRAKYSNQFQKNSPPKMEILIKITILFLYFRKLLPRIQLSSIYWKHQKFLVEMINYSENVQPETQALSSFVYCVLFYSAG